MKKIIFTILAAATLLSAPPAWAWIYNDGDALLVFRKSGQDFEYDLGSVTNFLGKTNGYTATVSNWDPTQLTGAVGSFIGAKVVLLATGQTNYLSSPDPNTTAYNIDAQEADGLHGVINGIGTAPLNPLAIPSNSPNAYVIDTGGDFASSSYDSVVSGGQFFSIAQLGGNAPFTVEQVLPASLDFWQIQSSSVYPNPPPDNLIGVFNVATNGVITFVAGPRQSKIISVTRSGNVSAVQFTTTVGNTYSVAYTNQLGAATAAWPVDATTLIGDGRTDTLNHTNSGDAAEFYRVGAQ
jgi:hypothetical protein